MSYAGDERGKRHYEMQKRAALHREREQAVRVSCRVSCDSRDGEMRTGISHAFARKSLRRRGISFVRIRAVENKCTLSSNAVQVPTRLRKDFKKDTDG